MESPHSELTILERARKLISDLWSSQGPSDEAAEAQLRQRLQQGLELTAQLKSELNLTVSRQFNDAEAIGVMQKELRELKKAVKNATTADADLKDELLKKIHAVRQPLVLKLGVLSEQQALSDLRSKYCAANTATAARKVVATAGQSVTTTDSFSKLLKQLAQSSEAQRCVPHCYCYERTAVSVVCLSVSGP